MSNALTSASELNAHKPYPFEEREFIIQMTAQPADPDNPESKAKIVKHKIIRPTFEQLDVWEKAQAYTTKTINPREKAILTDATIATGMLWDQISHSVWGYRFPETGIDWHVLSEEEKAIMPLSHKISAVDAMYLSECTLVRDEEEGVAFGSMNREVRQAIGSPSNPYYAIHELREPTQTELAKFMRTSSQLTSIPGGKTQTLKYTTYLRVYVEMYDLLIQKVTTAGQPVAVASIDPMYKQQVIMTFMGSLEAKITD